MRKKILVLVALFMFCAIGQYQAAANTAVLELNSATGQLSCTASLDVSDGTLVTICIYKPNCNSENVTKQNFGDAVLYFDTKPYNGTSVTFNTLIYQTDPVGYYNADISANGLTLISTNSVYFASEVEKSAAVNALNTALDELDTDTSTVKNIITEKNNIFNLNTGGIYADYPDGVIFAQLDCRSEFYEGEFEDVAEISTAWDKALAIQKLKSATVENIGDVYEEVYEMLNIPTNETGEVKNAVLRALVYVNKNEYSSNVKFGELEQLLKKATVLGKFNSAGRTEITQLLETYAEYLGIDLTEYNKVDKINVNKALENKEFTKLSDITAAFNERLKDMQDSGTGTGGGGGTVSNVGSGFTTDLIVPNNPVSKPSQDDITDVFSDVDDAKWASKYIAYLYKNDVINGVGDGKFKPNAMITREEAVKIILKAFELYIPSEDSANTFADVADDAWYAPYINASVKLNIINGISDEQFGVGQSITREDMAVITYRILSSKGIKYENKVPDFADASSISAYATEAVAALQQSEVINGTENGNFEPKQNCTRAQACKIICAALQSTGKAVE